MEILPYEQFGIAGMILGVLLWIVKAFLKRIKEITDGFNLTMINHLNHSNEVQIELKNSLENNTKALDKLINRL